MGRRDLGFEEIDSEGGLRILREGPDLEPGPERASMLSGITTQSNNTEY